LPGKKGLEVGRRRGKRLEEKKFCGIISRGTGRDQ